MTLHRAPSHPLLRQLGGGLAAVAAVQVLLLQPGIAGRLVSASSGVLALCVVFGLVAFLAWLVTGVRWPLLAWAVVVLLVAIDLDLQPQPGDRDAFGAFADGAAVPAPLLSAQGPSEPARADRLTRNGD
jgi:hypothetical protein